MQNKPYLTMKMLKRICGDMQNIGLAVRDSNPIFGKTCAVAVAVSQALAK